MPPREKLPRFSEDNPQVVSTKNLAIPLWMVVSMIAGTFTFTVYMVNLLNTIRLEVRQANTNRWGKNEQRQFAQELERANLGKITVPDIDAVANRFQN